MPSEYTIKAFQGLDLRTDPEDVGETAAVDMLNVHLDHPEKIQTRPGWTPFSAASSSDVTALGWFTDSTGLAWIVGSDSGGTLRPYKLTDATAGSTSANTARYNNSFTAFGDPTHTLLLVGTGGTGIFSFDGSVWNAVGGYPGSDAAFLAATNDSRVAAAGLGSSRVYFSNAGDYATWGASNWVDLWPGDGDNIRALIRWRDKLFAFKQSKFAVFGGTSIDATGNPVFNYYGVDSGHGAYIPGAAVAGDEGVYFVDSALGDVYVTTGGDPVYISGPLEPWLRGEIPSLPSRNTAQLTYCDHKLYVNYQTCQAVLNTITNRWTIWNLSMSSALGIQPFRTVYFGEPASNKIATLGGTTDNGTAIPWHYTSGLYDMGVPGQEKIISWSHLTGTGTVTLERFADYGTSDANNGTLALGSSTSTGMHRVAWRGTLMQHKLSGSASGSVSSLAHAVQVVRPAGIRSA